MLLKFTSSDIYQTSIIDCATGDVAYRTTTERPERPQRARSGSWATTSSASSSGSQKQPPTSAENERRTFVEDGDGNIVAEITWEGNSASLIRIGDDLIKGTTELFDAAFVKILPDETLLPTRSEYVWRLTADSLMLLDDDEEVIGRLHQNCVTSKGEPKLVPAPSRGAGLDYLEFSALPEDETVEMLVCYLLLSTLRERMYSITKYVYGRDQTKDPIARLRRRATRSIANLRNTFRRKAT